MEGPLRDFTAGDYQMTEESLGEKYQRRTGQPKRPIKHGQRKLFIGELMFLCYTWKPDTPSPIVVYAGAYPGVHIPLLAKFFPEITWHLYDPKFAYHVHPGLAKDTNINVIPDIFTEDTASKWSLTPNVYFISDIRVDDYFTSSAAELERSIAYDMELQMTWYNIMNPVAAFLKFRLPYSMASAPSKLIYLNGYVFFQPWTGPTSSETRLLVKRGTEPKEKEWDIVAYDNKLYYHNAVVREEYQYRNPFTGDGASVFADELINDVDSMCEVEAFRLYLDFRDQDRDTREDRLRVSTMSWLLTEALGKGSLAEKRKRAFKG
jgi:hypothetical protein